VADEPSGERPPALSRHALEHVIARAVELSLAETDANEQISEDELVRIAEELGLSARHVKQALYERPPEDRPVGFLDRNFGSESVSVVRSVPHDQPIALSRLEDYLVTREYLQLRRRQGMNAYFEPAEDAFSSIARAFSRPSGRFHIARTQRAYLTVRPLEPGWSHIRLEVCYPDQRRRTAATGAVLGGLVGGVLGPLAGIQVALLSQPLGPWGTVLGVLTGVATMSGTISLGWSAAKAQFRKFLTRSREEADALLDRLEQGEELRPPASPWLRRLQQRLRFGSPRAS
jgi:hypothetical protein